MYASALIKHIQTIDTKIPSSYKRMQELISATFEETNFVDRNEIENIIESVKEEDESLREVKNEVILRILHSLAFCFWFDKIDGVSAVVLNPRWITGAVYKIINWVQKADPYNNASIDISDFDDALRTPPEDAALFPKEKDGLIFNILKNFELAYSDGDTLVIPHCLKDKY
jgi:hypothetical protein